MIENTVWKDVVRTDRKNPFYYGDDNPNIETLRYHHYRLYSLSPKFQEHFTQLR